MPPIPVYVDSPMALAATEIYGKYPQLYDAEAAQLLRAGQFIQDMASVQTCQTADESRALNSVPGPCIIIAGSGMCNAAGSCTISSRTSGGRRQRC